MSDLVNCLIIGYGSMGERHASILSEMGNSVHVVSKRDIKDFQCYKSIKEALQNRDFDYAIIANETYNHYNSFMELNELRYLGKLLIEKPVFLEPCSLPQLGYENVFVAYNLRFHPVIQRLREFLNGKEIYSIQVYVGQYLPDWRPDTDYTGSYSASMAQGGGVLRDLSHELDYINWIAGVWKRVTAIGGKFSDLQIDSDDVFVLLLEMENCPVASVQMNYLDRKTRREIIVNMKDHTIKADLLMNTMEINGEILTFEAERNLTYILEHKAILNENYDDVCTFDQGMDILNLIQATEVAANKQVWVYRSNLGELS
ncbi:MAG: Gfo/Idh/MocA family oxidoreductase [Deltaproteobacteria bacterium]|nr:Gfo/Idh/MocA family oxidoreductase [Deltaproteobacteria bacterium]